MKWQFTIRALLVAVLCIGCALAGFKFGQSVERRRERAFYTRVYPIGDLGNPDQLRDTLETIDPHSWDPLGGLGHCFPSDDLKSFVVYQTGENHDAIAAVLKDLRDARQPK